jgi:hypothetical protein
VSKGNETIAAAEQAATNADREYFRIRLARLSPSPGDKRKGIGVMRKSPRAPGRRPRKSENLAASGNRLTSWEFPVSQAYALKNQELRVAQAIQIN